MDSSIDAALATLAEWKSIDQQVKAALRREAGVAGGTAAVVAV